MLFRTDYYRQLKMELLLKKFNLDIENLSVMTDAENQDIRIKAEYKVSKL